MLNKFVSFFTENADFKQKKLDLINEQKSPLFRIMSVFDDVDVPRRKFENNICAFHIGNGFIMSVAHNLRIKTNIFQSIPEHLFQDRVIQNINQVEAPIFNRNYVHDPQNNKRYLNPTNQNEVLQIIQILNRIRFDGRYVSMYADSICKPFLIIQFENNMFYNDPKLTAKFNINHIFHEAQLFRYTFLIELELIKAFYNQDIALYRIINTDKEVINKIPSIQLDFGIYDRSENNYFCLQCAPIDNLGRLINRADIEGLLDHWNSFKDDIGGNYILEGLRYLIKGYFRFGSSGAPYLVYNSKESRFKINAIQSEASPIQLSINNNMQGNFQYINAIASPVNIIEKELRRLLN